MIYTAPYDGGSPIVNYEVQMDDGLGSGLKTVAGGIGSTYLLTFY